MTSAQAPRAPAAEPVPKPADPFVVPDGTPAELLDYIDHLWNLAPDTPHDPQAVREFAGKLCRAVDAAADAYAAFGKALAGSPSQAIAALGTRMTGAARRLTLVGKPMPLEGTFLDGTPLDWSTYQGKVVLVQFWATWCQPCMVEIANIQKNYALYHDRGFEVIGVNLDEDRQQVVEFLETNKLPWNSLLSNDPTASGMNSPLAVEYGVMGIPMLILVGPDGKVVSLAARGPELGKLLERLLGPAKPAPAAERRPG